MKCYCCNKILSDFEATLRNSKTKEFTDVCIKCLKDLPIQTTGRDDLLMKQKEIEYIDYGLSEIYSDDEN